MKTTRDADHAPYIVVYIDVIFPTQGMFLVVKNIGKSLAEKIRLTFNPELVCSSDSDMSEEERLCNISFVKNGIGSLAPGQEIRTFFDNANQYLSEPDFPSCYAISITYLKDGKTDVTTEQMLDLDAFRGLRTAGIPRIRFI